MSHLKKVKKKTHNHITFYPWIPLAAERNIPCSADWVVTIVEPRDNLKTLYEGRKNGKQDDQGSVVINE